jgi:hypothetical protein
MIAFHVDMNMAHYRGDYLKRWLRELACRGYDTVVWEVENAVAWETCPECVPPDAFSKDAFRDLIAECRGLGLEPVPLFQTIGHAEYVLKHPPYAHLKELPERIDQYCPRNPDLVPFLHRWIEEYLEVFGEVALFHLGADEAWALGTCPRCRAFAEDHSLSRLYIDHVNAVAEPLIRRGIAPAIWADMVLHYPEALDALSRRIVLFDWMYDIYRGNGKVFVWGAGLRHREALDPQRLIRFWPYLFPRGDEPGREPETFYTADYLADQGFRVVTCPAASSHGDNVFAPRHWYHLANTRDSFLKGAASRLAGSLLTSWSVRLFPWELQLSCIDLPGFLQANPAGSLDGFQDWFARHRFGLPDGAELFAACGLLSKPCLFSHSSSLGVTKACLPVDAGHVAAMLARVAHERRVAEERAACRARQVEYSAALERFQALSARATRGHVLLDVWELAARNLLSRARTSEFLLAYADDVIAGRALEGERRDRAQQLLSELQSLRDETDALYATIVRPTRKDLMVAAMFASVESALAGLAGVPAS